MELVAGKVGGRQRGTAAGVNSLATYSIISSLPFWSLFTDILKCTLTSHFSLVPSVWGRIAECHMHNSDC